MVFQTQEYSAQDWVKTRCSLDDSQSTFLTWKGNIYAFVPGEKRKLLFKGKNKEDRWGELLLNPPMNFYLKLIKISIKIFE